MIAVFRDCGVDALHDTEAAVEALADERLRAEFSVKLKQFLATLDFVLPRPEGLLRSRRRRSGRRFHTRAEPLPRASPARQGDRPQGPGALDEHIISLGIDPRIPPIAITDKKFADQVGRQVADRAKASRMEHAVRHHLKKKLDEDPVFYQKLSERLEEYPP